MANLFPPYLEGTLPAFSLTSINNATEWNSTETYFIGDIVSYEGKYYKCLLDNVKNEIPSGLVCWEIYTDGEGIITIPFSHNKAVASSEVKDLIVKVKTVQNDVLIASGIIGDYNPDSKEIKLTVKDYRVCGQSLSSYPSRFSASLANAASAANNYSTIENKLNSFDETIEDPYSIVDTELNNWFNSVELAVTSTIKKLKDDLGETQAENLLSNQEFDILNHLDAMRTSIENKEDIFSNHTIGAFANVVYRWATEFKYGEIEEYTDWVLKVGQYYKIQIAYRDINDTVGYYSTVGVIKCTSTPRIYIENFQRGITNNLSNKFIGVFRQVKGGDTAEKVYSSSFVVTDDLGNIIKDSGEMLHNVENNPDGYTSTDEYEFNYDIPVGKIYHVQYKVVTTNGLKLSSYNYSIVQQISLSSDFKGTLSATMNSDEGYVDLYLQGEIDENGVEVVCSGIFVLSREDTSNPGYWDTLYTFSLSNEQPTRHLFKDFTIEHGKTYNYCIQQVNANNLYSDRIKTKDSIYASFEDLFIYDGERQLKMRFNPQVSSVKTQLSESRSDTIGSKYPFFYRNARVGYKILPVSGLISMQMDDNELFIQYEDIMRAEKDKSHNHGKSGGFTDKIHSDFWLDDKNFASERIFKMKVLDWFNDGKPKLFKSPAEGNYILRFMDTSMSPNTTVGRMLHTLNTTGYECAECNYSNFIKYGLIREADLDINDFSFSADVWKEINLTSTATYNISFVSKTIGVNLKEKRKNYPQLMQDYKTDNTLKNWWLLSDWVDLYKQLTGKDIPENIMMSWSYNGAVTLLNNTLYDTPESISQIFSGIKNKISIVDVIPTDDPEKWEAVYTAHGYNGCSHTYKQLITKNYIREEYRATAQTWVYDPRLWDLQSYITKDSIWYGADLDKLNETNYSYSDNLFVPDSKDAYTDNVKFSNFLPGTLIQIVFARDGQFVDSNITELDDNHIEITIGATGDYKLTDVRPIYGIYIHSNEDKTGIISTPSKILYRYKDTVKTDFNSTVNVITKVGEYEQFIGRHEYPKDFNDNNSGYNDDKTDSIPFITMANIFKVRLFKRPIEYLYYKNGDESVYYWDYNFQEPYDAEKAMNRSPFALYVLREGETGETLIEHRSNTKINNETITSAVEDNHIDEQFYLDRLVAEKGSANDMIKSDEIFNMYDPWTGETFKSNTYDCNVYIDYDDNHQSQINLFDIERYEINDINVPITTSIGVYGEIFYQTLQRIYGVEDTDTDLIQAKEEYEAARDLVVNDIKQGSDNEEADRETMKNAYQSYLDKMYKAIIEGTAKR